MNRYDYYTAVKDDCVDFIYQKMEWENISKEDMAQMKPADDIFEEWYDDAWVEDSVTGNGSGSYTFSTWQAEENLCHNTDLMEEAMTEFGYESSTIGIHGAEWWDVTIRCYLLRDCFFDALNEVIEEAKEEAHEATDVN